MSLVGQENRMTRSDSETGSQSSVSRKTIPKLHIVLETDQWENRSVTPWYSYRVNFPIEPIPSVSDRPHLKTPRLVVRPIVPDDLESFHELRREPETQSHSLSRGRPDRDIEETKANIERLQAPYDVHHWYFGAFLLSTGEMIGEGGMPDIKEMNRTGWPEPEFLIKPEYRRQGYGTEMVHAVLNSWWSLPRSIRRQQLWPMILGDKGPGDRVTEGVTLYWEETNVAFKSFVSKTFGEDLIAADGGFTEWDQREGREGNLIQWSAVLVANPQELEYDPAASDMSFYQFGT